MDRVKWLEIENATMTTVSSVEGQIVHALNDTASQFAMHSPESAFSGLPLAVGIGFVPGLVIGFKRGKRMISIAGQREHIQIYEKSSHSR